MATDDIVNSRGRSEADTHSLLGNSLREKGDIEGAILEYWKATTLEPDNLMAHSFLGEALEMNGELDGAIADFGEAVRLKPDHADSHWKLGEALEEKGGVEADWGDPNVAEDILQEAASEYAWARELSPEDELISEMYSRLDPEMKRCVERLTGKRSDQRGNPASYQSSLRGGERKGEV